MAKTKQTYSTQSYTTPRGKAVWPRLTEPDSYTEKYQTGIEVEDTPEWEAFLASLLSFQNDCLQQAGEDPQSDLIALKDIKVKDEGSDKYVPSGRKQLVFKSADKTKFSVVDAAKKPMREDTNNGATIRVNGNAAFGFMKGDPYVTLYLSAVQVIENTASGGVDAFDDESDGGADPTPFNNETPDHASVELA